MEKFLYKIHIFLLPCCILKLLSHDLEPQVVIVMASCDCGEMICNCDSVGKSFKAINSIPEDYLIHPELFLFAEVNLVFCCFSSEDGDVKCITSDL